MLRRQILFTTLALIGCLGSLPAPVQAEIVETDSGSTGSFVLESTGPGGIGQSISLMLATDFNAQLQTINGSPVGPFPAFFPDNLLLTIANFSTFGGTTIFEFVQTGSFRKIFDFGEGGTAELSIVIDTGLASDSLPFNLVLGGTATLVTNSDVYDFSNFANGGSQSFSLDATALTPAGNMLSPDVTFRNIVLNGGTAMGSGSFAEVATETNPVPEPGSLTSLLVGLTATGGWRLWRRRGSSPTNAAASAV